MNDLLEMRSAPLVAALLIDNASRGKTYTYRVRARFEESSGTGQRLAGRDCEFRFDR